MQKERQTPRALLHTREKTPLKARFVCALRRTVEENERGDVLWTVIKVGPHEAIAIDLREEMRVSSAAGEGGGGAWKRGGKAGRSGRVDRVAKRRCAPWYSKRRHRTTRRCSTGRARDGYLLLRNGAAELPQGRLVVARHHQSIRAVTV